MENNYILNILLVNCSHCYDIDINSISMDLSSDNSSNSSGDIRVIDIADVDIFEHVKKHGIADLASHHSFKVSYFLWPKICSTCDKMVHFLGYGDNIICVRCRQVNHKTCMRKTKDICAAWVEQSEYRSDSTGA
jgi:hypothetical protein